MVRESFLASPLMKLRYLKISIAIWYSLRSHSTVQWFAIFIEISHLLIIYFVFQTEGPDSDEEDDIIKPEDNLLLVGHVESDASILEVYSMLYFF